MLTSISRRQCVSWDAARALPVADSSTPPAELAISSIAAPGSSTRPCTCQGRKQRVCETSQGYTAFLKSDTFPHS